MKRVDSNQAVIVAVLRAAGASVVDLHEVGKGCPDVLVGFLDKNYLIEIKAPGGKFTDAEVKFAENWRGQVDTARTPSEALAIIGAEEYVFNGEGIA